MKRPGKAGWLALPIITLSPFYYFNAVFSLFRSCRVVK
jgi:hypothetical protein